MKFFFTIIAVFCCNLIWGQCYNGEIPVQKDSWGIGLISIPVSSTIVVKNGNSHQKLGILKRSKEGFITFEIHDKKKLDESHLDVINNFRSGNFLSIGHPANKYLTVQSTSINGDYHVLNVGLENAIVNKTDIEKVGGKFYKYNKLLKVMDSLPSKWRNNYLCSALSVSLKDRCLNLRKSPNVKSEKIICINRHFQVELYKAIYLKIISPGLGNWIKVEAQEYVVDNLINGEECPLVKGKLYKGWIKYLDDTGQPNIWYYVSSY
ncbi:hypothetical protein QQ020_24400 [Fulvivirgaceae bacterium BMA12]|uniref:SH3 domain-containing protein n=1 Tax=Agaribacillus aureus TaxID=3051825 RepID=A0ABT8LBV6_9BACT|nr:hypothetical protein [Fulvivirgaceae bacterium BMA12]